MSQHIFTKPKSNVLTSEKFAAFVVTNEICEFYLTGADDKVSVKSTCFDLRKSGYQVTVLSDCITSWDKKKIDEMLNYYESKGAKVVGLNDFTVT